MPEFSVIVPVYNVENYIGRCIESILAQTFVDFELILVDDGSQDKSGKICDQYAAEDNRIKVLHQKNKGVSAARNAGLELAKGKHVVFVDSDDAIKVDYLSCMAAVDENIDLVVCGVENVFPDGRLLRSTYYEEQLIVEIRKKEVLYMVENSTICCIYDKRFKRQLLEEQKIRFDDTLCLAEDTYFSATYLCCCKTIQFIEEALYQYYRYSEKTLSTYYDDCTWQLLEAYKKIEDILMKHFPGIQESIIWKKRYFEVFPYGIFGILRNEEDSNLTKYLLLKKIIRMDRFEDFVREIDVYMHQDSKLIRKVIATRNPIIILFFWKLLSLWKCLKRIFFTKDTL